MKSVRGGGGAFDQSRTHLTHPSGSGGYRHSGGLTVAPSHAIQVALRGDDQVAVVDLGLQAGPDPERGGAAMPRDQLLDHLLQGETLGDEVVVEALVQGVGSTAGALGDSLDLESGAHAATSTRPPVLKLCRALSSMALSAWRPL